MAIVGFCSTVYGRGNLSPQSGKLFWIRTLRFLEVRLRFRYANWNRSYRCERRGSDTRPGWRNRRRPARTNLITIEHADGSVAAYSHLTLNGVHVTAGQQVLAGDAIGLSGNTGNTGGFPHLHFSLHPCRSLPGLGGTDNCPSMPMNFRNTDANPEGLISNRNYQALPLPT